MRIVIALLLVLQLVYNASAFARATQIGPVTACGIEILDEMVFRAAMASLGGRHAEALSYYQRLQTLSLQTLGEKHIFSLMRTKDLGDAYYLLGRYSEALALYEKGLTVARNNLGERHIHTIWLMEDIAAVYRALGRYEEALILNEKSFALSKSLFNERYDVTMEAMNELAHTYMLLGRFDDALKLSERAVKNSRDVFGENNYQTSWGMQQLGVLYYETGHYEQAKTLLLRSLTTQKNNLSERHDLTLDTMFRLANTYFALGQQTEGLQLLEKTLKIRTDNMGIRHPKTINIMYTLAAKYYELGRVSEAEQLLNKAVAAIEVIRAEGNLSDENRQSFFTQYIDSYKLLCAIYVTQGRTVEAFRLTELSKARTLLETATARFADQSGILEATEATTLQNYEKQLTELNKAIGNTFSEMPREGMYLKLSETDNTQDDIYQRQAERRIALELQKDQLLKKYKDYRQTLISKYPRYAQLNEAKVITVQEGQALIAPDTAFVSYIVRNNGDILAMVLTNHTMEAVKVGTLPNFEKTLQAYSAILQGKPIWKMEDGSYEAAKIQPEKAVAKITDKNEISKMVGEKLLAPLQRLIGGKTHWVISPDGVLSFIPFETLLVDNEMAIMNHDIHYVQSLSMMALLFERGKEYNALPRKELLAMGAAEYQASPASTTERRAISLDEHSDELLRGKNNERGIFDRLQKVWGNLPASEDELKNLQRLYGDQAVVYKHADASEAKLQELNKLGELARYRYIVFSTHGFFFPPQPSLNAIVLSQVNKAEGTDGYITAIKWPRYNLKSDLMMLSACDTGLGKFVQGEGVVGLPFALYVAGNKNTVFTLWQVADKSTAEFTSRFFSKIKAGQSHYNALNETKREFIKDPAYARTLFWAPFVLYGI